MRRPVLFSLMIALAVALAVFFGTEPARIDPDDDQVAARLQAELRATATPEMVRGRIAELLAAGQPEEAESYIALARLLGYPLPADLLAEYERATSASANTRRYVGEGMRGFVSGEVDGVASLVGSTVADFVVYGDVRDVTLQVRNIALGREVDEFILGLSLFGLGVTATTVASAGASAPVKAGMSVIKAAKRSGKLTAGLQKTLHGAITAALDMPGLRRHLDWKAPGRTIGMVRAHTAALDLSAPKALAKNVGSISAKTSPAGALRIVRHVDSADELAKAERVATRFGKATPAIFETLGKSVFKSFAKLVLLAAHILWTALAACLSFIASWVFWRVIRRIFTIRRA